MSNGNNDYPRRVTFHITDRCRYACRFCFVPPIRSAEELPAAVWVRAARELAEARPGVEIVLTGGEPILFDGVFDVIRAASGAGAIVHFNSSGVGVGPDEARLLDEAGARHFNLSLDGPPEIHNCLRGNPEAFRFAMETLDNLAGNAPDIRRNIVCVILGANLELLPEFLRKLEEDDRVQGVYLQLATNPLGPNGGDAWLADPDLRHPDAAVRARVMDEIIAGKWEKILNPVSALETMRGLMSAEKMGTDENFRDGKCTGNGSTGKVGTGVIFRGEKCTSPHFSRCDLPDFGFSIDARGDVSLCGLYPPAGNIARQSIADIMGSGDFGRIEAEMRCCRLACHRRVNCSSALDEKGEPV